MVRRRQKYLTPYAPSINSLEKLGEGIALYGPSIGASLVNRYKQVAPDSYEVEEVITCSDKAAKLFSANGKLTQIRLHSPHEFEVGDRTFNDDLHFAAFFAENGAC